MVPGFAFRSGLSVEALRERAEDMHIAVAEILERREPANRLGCSRIYSLDELTSWQIVRGTSGEPELIVTDATPGRSGAPGLRLPAPIRARLLCTLLGTYADEVDAARKRQAEKPAPASEPATAWPNR